MKSRTIRCLTILIPSFLGALPLHATVVPNGLFCDHAVLQQGRAVPVWGTASEGEKVSVEFAGQSAETVAKDGLWKLTLKPLEASASPRQMVIRGASNTVTLGDILVGEVWICSGQSNMERKLAPRTGNEPIVNWEQEVAAADYPQIRHFEVHRAVSTNPLVQVSSSWEICSPKTAPNFTAVGYFFGRDLYKELHVPIGLIHSSWGGTPARAWTSKEAMATNPALAPILDFDAAEHATYGERLAKYRAEEPELLKKYAAEQEKARADNEIPPRKPAAPLEPAKDYRGASMLFNGMINPLIPYAIRGVIWYQGEADYKKAGQYRTLFPAMVADWRARWGEGDFPFLFVQIAPYGNSLPEIREAQLLSLPRIPVAAMVVTTDVGDPKNIHPVRKQHVGARLALAAQAIAYGRKIEYSGPLYRGVRAEGDTMVVSFTHVGSGLTSDGKPLEGFTIAASDGKFLPAQAVIRGDEVVVSSPEVKHPASVRYGWAPYPDPECNLSNKEGLPASTFRSDPE
jgi:sialate O-acetylesterase